MTDDRIYSLSESSKALLRKTDAPIEVTLFLDGELGSGFRQLRTTAVETLNELRLYAHGLKVKSINLNAADEATRRQYLSQGIRPYEQTKTAHNGKTEVISTYPYALICYKGHQTVVPLFTRTFGQTEEEDLNTSIRQLEFTFMEAIHRLQQSEMPAVAILRSQGDTDERYTQDLQDVLRPYFQVKRVFIDPNRMNVHVFDGFKAIIIANPQSAFSDVERYIIDQYIMRGGAVFWAVNGIRFSDEMLQSDGVTPVIENDVGITDLLYRYGARIDPILVQDLQCLSIQLNVSPDPKVPNLQPFPWTYAPLLLLSQYSPITATMQAPVSSDLISPVDFVGGNDGIRKMPLLGTSTATKLTGTPNEVNLNDIQPDPKSFVYQNVPVAASLEGAFPSAYAHRMIPEGVITDEPIRKQGMKTRQVVVGSGSIVMNQWYGNQPLPMGFDRSSKMQYGNRDFVVNSMLWLTHTEELIPLRAKSATMRLLNDKRAHDERSKVQTVSVISPIVILALIGGIVWIIRKRKYAVRKV